MYDEVVDNYSHALKFVPDCYKTKKMCDKSVTDYPSEMQLVSDCCITQ